jgi:phosphoglycerate-specific signal transduction histidine kinase
VQDALQRLSGTYFPRQSEIVRLEEMLSESRDRLRRLKRMGNEAEQLQRVTELTQKVSRFKVLNRYFRSGKAPI